MGLLAAGEDELNSTQSQMMSLPLRDRWGTNSMALDNIRAPNPWWVCPSDCGFHLIVSVFFSRMRSKGSRFTLGVWGLSVCSLDVAFVVATVHTRPHDPRMAVPMGSSAEGVLFVGFKLVVASFRVAGVALRDIQTCFVTCRQSFCVAGAILLRGFQKMGCIFRGRRSTLDVSHWQGCVKWRQGAISVAGVAFCEMCWKLTEASHETSILRKQI